MRRTSIVSRHALRFVLAALVVSLFAGPVMAQTLDEIIACNIENRGGMEAMKAIDTAKLTGNLAMGGGMEAPFTLYVQRPDRMRMEIEIQGMTGVQAYDGETGWAEMPFMGNPEPQKMADDQLKQTRQQADFDGPLVDWKEKGHQIELIGQKDLDGTQAHELKITLADGDNMTVYLDTEYCLQLRQERKINMQGHEMDINVILGDYKEVAGVVFPHSYEQRFAGAAAGQMMTIENIEVGVEVDDAMFTMPEPKAEEPAAAAGGR